MSPTGKPYVLELLFDKERITEEELDKRIAGLLADDRGDALCDRLQVDLSRNAKHHPMLSVTGELEDVDDVHKLIDEHIISSLIRPQNPGFVRIRDDVSNEVRRRAYPVVTSIELSLRSFVDHASTSFWGFQGWYDFVDLVLGKKIKRVIGSEGNVGLTSTPLECAQFGDLVGLVTKKSAEGVISAADLPKLVSEASSLKELVDGLEKKVAPTSAWEQVFHLFFEDTDDWKQIEGDLKFAEQMRHRIMHHRPMPWGVLEPLTEKQKRVEQFFQRAKYDLTGAELEQARAGLATITYFQASVATNLNASAEVELIAPE